MQNQQDHFKRVQILFVAALLLLPLSVAVDADVWVAPRVDYGTFESNGGIWILVFLALMLVSMLVTILLSIRSKNRSERRREEKKPPDAPDADHGRPENK